MKHLILFENFKNNINDNFWRWFSKSKIVTENNKPLIVYHGTNNGVFDTFNITLSKSTSNHPSNRLGYFFTYEKDLAVNYSLRKINKFEDEKPKNSRVYDVYLKIENPFYIDYNEYYKLTENPSFDILSFKNDLIKKGYDGIVVGNFEVIAFNSNQIKSVDNDGSWDDDDNNIYS